jgi:hypothetical protein
MARSSYTGTSKADTAINNVQREIRQMETRDWLTISEKSILDGKQRTQSVKPSVTQVKISHYNPDSPLKGSKFWTTAQWDSYKAKVKADKAQAKRDAKTTL